MAAHPADRTHCSRHSRQAIAYIVSAEVYVDEILDRDEFRAHCDRKKSFRRIVDSLR